jgi:hypothetical protein
MRACGPNTRPGPRLRPRRATSTPRQNEWAVFSGRAQVTAQACPPASLPQSGRPSGQIVLGRLWPHQVARPFSFPVNF